MLEEWARHHEVVAIYLHGSRVTGRARPDSDFDVAVLLKAAPADWEVGEILREKAQRVVAEHLSIPAGRVDVQLLNEAPLAFQYRVVKASRLLCETDRELRAGWQTRLLSEYLDFRYYEERYYHEMRQRLKEGRFGRRAPIRRAPAGRD